jgi:hypothetical protein
VNDGRPKAWRPVDERQEAVRFAAKLEARCGQRVMYARRGRPVTVRDAACRLRRWAAGRFPPCA